MNNNVTIGLGELKLDPQNPRIPKSLRDSNPSEVDLINYMLLDASLIELMLAIGQNGYFPGEQLLVVKDDEDGGKKIFTTGHFDLLICDEAHRTIYNKYRRTCQ